MKISIKGYIYHKDAESYEDCFDRYGVNIETNKFCVSDGVSKSFFPGIWAELLVDNFIKTDKRINLADASILKLVQDQWGKRVQEIVNRPNQKYFVRNFFAQGRTAAATFVGLNFFIHERRLCWESFALGDSFLFFVPKDIGDITRDFEKVTFVSSKSNFEFDNFPDFFDSRSLISKGRIKQVKRDLVEGTFYLMTDALSEWFISKKQIAVQEIRSWKSQNDYEDRIAYLRKESLHNDDSAILIIDVEHDNIQSFNYEIVDVSNLDELIIGKPNATPSYIDDVDRISSKFDKSYVETRHKSLDLRTESAVTTQSGTIKDKKLIKAQKKKSFWEKRFNDIADLVDFLIPRFLQNIDKDVVLGEPHQSASLPDNGEPVNKKLKKKIREADSRIGKRDFNNGSEDLDSITDKF